MTWHTAFLIIAQTVAACLPCFGVFCVLERHLDRNRVKKEAAQKASHPVDSR
jgi:hypothetical protein